MKTKTIEEIKQKLKEINVREHPMLDQLAVDSRKGVKRLLKQWYRNQEHREKERARYKEMNRHEELIRSQGYKQIAGIDEAGRGPLAGPVVAAAVILPAHCYIEGLNDSKKLTEEKREQLYAQIKREAVSVGVGIISAEEIDRMNIFKATRKSMMAAVNHLSTQPDYLLVDAMDLSTPYPQTSVIKGDEASVSIAAASIIAKVTRDRLMIDMSKLYPKYRFDLHKGYSTKKHLELLRTYGPCLIHRKSFAPVQEAMK